MSERQKDSRAVPRSGVRERHRSPSGRLVTSGPPSSASGRFFLAWRSVAGPVDSLLRRDTSQPRPSRRAERPLPHSLEYPPVSTDTNFSVLGVPAHLVTVLDDLGITVPTPIQAATLPDSLAGRDVLGRGRTGSGKTYAFLLPLLTRLSQSGQRRQARRPRALILAPTRELVTQIDTAMAPLAKALGLTSQTIFGGVGQNPQVQGLRNGVDVIVACPGRLEVLMQQGHVFLDGVEITILDEADHMADLGFLPGVRRIMEKTPPKSQRLLFSATLDGAINVLVKRFLTNPVTHEADSAQSPVSTMSHHVLHGNLSQGARTRNMDDFHSGRAQTLVATDIAARGIHVDDVALVIHADPPVEHKAYLHRSGRTARA